MRFEVVVRAGPDSVQTSLNNNENIDVCVCVCVCVLWISKDLVHRGNSVHVQCIEEDLIGIYSD
jgi:hypothetical protein